VGYKENRMEFSSFKEATNAVRDYIRTEAGSFNNLALALFRLQSAHVETLGAFCASRNIIPKEVQFWDKIPAIPTTAFRDFEITSIPETERTHEFHSSGTTSTRSSRHWHNEESLQLYKESLAPWFENHVPASGYRFIHLTPSPEKAPHSSLVHMLDTVSTSPRHFAAIATPDGWQTDAEIVNQCIDDKMPVCLAGPAFAFVQWFDQLSGPIHLPDQSVVMETGGYKGRTRELAKDELHEWIQKMLGVPRNRIVSEYGMCELSSQAYDLQAGSQNERLLRFPHWARALTIDPESGQRASNGSVGLLRVVDLANVRSVCCVQTQDLAIEHEDGFELMGRDSETESRGCSLNILQS